MKSCRGGGDEQCLQAANFVACKISQVAKIVTT